MAFTKKNEEAVSPVIGVILMVAITVILAAVIAAFVFGMAGNIQKTKVVAATEQRVNNTMVTITFQGGQDAGSLSSLTFTVDGANVTPKVAGTLVTVNGDVVIPNPSGTATSIPVGSSIYIPASSPGKNHIIGIGTFADGSNQVVLDTTL